jgi:predicted NBD/HSP70 family sugar kinase
MLRYSRGVRTLWGVDLGGTKIEGIVVDAERPAEPIARLRIPTGSYNGYAHVVAACASLVESLERETGLRRPDCIGFGTPGSTDPATGLMRNCNTVCLNGRPLSRDLSSALARPVSVMNDANCFALAEALLGAAKGVRCVFGVILGTGVGGGMVLDGQAWTGLNGIAGEWGHTVVEPDGEPCYCGRRGCVETVISGPALERRYRDLTGQELSLAGIVGLHRTGGNTAATEIVNRLCREFGRCLATVVNVLDPDVIVVGGGVGQVQEIYDLGTLELKKHVFHESPRLDVRRPALGDSAGVFGAALQARTYRPARH